MNEYLLSSNPASHSFQPKRRGTGGGGSGDDLFVRELIEPEKSVILTSWRDYAKRDGGEKFTESIQILNEMVRKREAGAAAKVGRCCGILRLRERLSGPLGKVVVVGSKKASAARLECLHGLQWTVLNRVGATVWGTRLALAFVLPGQSSRLRPISAVDLDGRGGACAA